MCTNTIHHNYNTNPITMAYTHAESMYHLRHQLQRQTDSNTIQEPVVIDASDSGISIIIQTRNINVQLIDLDILELYNAVIDQKWNDCTRIQCNLCSHLEAQSHAKHLLYPNAISKNGNMAIDESLIESPSVTSIVWGRDI